MNTLRIMLDEKDFRELVAGRTVEGTEGEFTVFLALADIGYVRMQQLIDQAAAEGGG